MSAGVTAHNQAIIYWKQIGKFTNYQISRYVVKVNIGNSQWVDYPVFDDIITSKQTQPDKSVQTNWYWLEALFEKYEIFFWLLLKIW